MAWLGARDADWWPADAETVAAVLDAAAAGDTRRLAEYNIKYPVGVELDRAGVESILVQLPKELLRGDDVAGSEFLTRYGVNVTAAADYLMETYRISAADAVERLERQVTYEHIGTAIQDVAGSGFAGIWVDHSSGGELVISGTENEALLRSLERVGAKGSEIRAQVVTHSLADLAGARDQIEARLTESESNGFRRAEASPVRIDVTTNSLFVEHSPGRRSELERAIGPSDRQPSDVQISLREMPVQWAPGVLACPQSDCAPPHQGGMANSRGGRPNSSCSNGFTVGRTQFVPLEFENGHILTAGHCGQLNNNNVRQDWLTGTGPIIGRQYWEQFDTPGDTVDASVINRVGRGGSTSPGTIWRPFNSAFPIWSIAQPTSLPVNAIFCRVGANPTQGFESCGPLLETFSTFPGVVDLPQAGLFSIFACAGDSGGPIFSAGSHAAVATVVGSEFLEIVPNPALPPGSNRCTTAPFRLSASYFTTIIDAFDGDHTNENLHLDVKSPGLLRVVTSPARPSTISVERLFGGPVQRDDWELNWVKFDSGPITVSFSDVPGWRTPLEQAATVIGGTTTPVTGTFVELGQLRVRTSPPVPSTISIDGVPRDDWEVWAYFEPGVHTVCYGLVPGFTPPPCENVTLTSGGFVDIQPVFTPNQGAPGPGVTGLLRVTTDPPVPSTILVNGIPRDSWALTWVKVPNGQHTISFTDVPGFATPDDIVVNVIGSTVTVEGEFVELVNVRVNAIDPGPPVSGLPGTIYMGTAANPFVARDDWEMWTWLPPSPVTICFGAIGGWAEPACQVHTPQVGVNLVVTGPYTQ